MNPIGPSFAQRAFMASRDHHPQHIPISDQMEDVERLYGIVHSMVSGEQELLSLIHRLAVYSDMDLNYRGDLISWQKGFDRDSYGYACEYKGILESMIGPENICDTGTTETIS